MKRYPWPDAERYFGFSPPMGGSDPSAVRYIYFLQQADLVKVGMAKNVKQRLEAFRLGSPRGLHLRGYREVPGALCRQVERKIHTTLDAHAVGREWFRMAAKDARAAAKPTIDLAWRAVRQFSDDGFWSPEPLPPPGPGMASGFAPIEIVAGEYGPEEGWLDRLRTWRPEFYQLARMLALDLPHMTEAMICATCEVSDGRDDLGRDVKIVAFDAHGFAGAEGLMEALLSHQTVKSFHTRWERGGRYWFEVPTLFLALAPISSLQENR